MITFTEAEKPVVGIEAGKLQVGQMGIDRDGDIHYMDAIGGHMFFRVGLGQGWMFVEDPDYKRMHVTPLPKGSTVTITSEV